ncbi:Eph receptor A2 [Sarotherodon galilaeus]
MQSLKGARKNYWYIAVTFSATMKTISFLNFLLFVPLTDGSIINVEGFEGKNVSFQCKHKIASKSNKYFCKDPCKGEGDILVTVESGRRAESGRIALVDSGDGSFTVTFSHLQLSDSQKYWCAVDRPGLDTYTEVQLAVKDDQSASHSVLQSVSRPPSQPFQFMFCSSNLPTINPIILHRESSVWVISSSPPHTTRLTITASIISDVSSTWTYQNTNITHFTTGTGTMKPTNLSTVLNFTAEEELKTNTGTIMYTTAVGFALIALLLLAVCIRKSRKTSKHKDYCNSTDFSNENQREVSCKYSDTDDRTNQCKKSSQSSSVSTHQQRSHSDPASSELTATKCSVPSSIYETIYFPSFPADSECSTTQHQNVYDNNSGIYVNTLSALVPKRKKKVFVEKTTKPKSCKNVESCTYKASPCVSCGSTAKEPKSLWFGLDLSEINPN